MPFSGLTLVPSGNNIIENPFLSFNFALLTTRLRLLNFFALSTVIGLVQATAHPKKGISNNSFLTTDVDGTISV